MIKFEYIESLYHQSNISLKEISEIIDEVRSNKHESLIVEIRKSKDEEFIKYAKLMLPAFNPSKTSNDKNNILATGIISIDIDLKNNDHINIDNLKNDVITIPECLYAYKSPSGGLKFGMKTDFEGVIDASNDTKERFKLAYKMVLKYIQAQPSKALKYFVADHTSDSILRSCFLSSDATAYFNIDCQTLQVNNSCIVKRAMTVQAISLSSDNILEELLKFIPRNLPYEKRLPINYAVFGIIGENGINRMFSHWLKSERDVLLQQLKDQYKGKKFGNFVHLLAVAKQNGYKEKSGYQLRDVRAEPSDYIFKKLISVDEASVQLQKIVQDFFTIERNTFVNISTGAGKSTKVLDMIANSIKRDKRILILVPTHALAEELMTKLSRARRDNFLNEIESVYPDKLDAFQNTSRAYKCFIRKEPIYSSAIHLKGKQQLCENTHAIEDFGSPSFIPWKCCSKCEHPTGCDYLRQFNNTFDNVRIMTHEEWSNDESVWAVGTDVEPAMCVVYPKKKSLTKTWRPDFIVIDENIIKISSKEIVRDNGERFESIRLVIESVNSGITLQEAAEKFVCEIIKDATKNVKPMLRAYKTPKEFQYARKEYASKISIYSPALDLLEKYIATRDADYLKGLWVSKGVLCYHKLPRPAPRYQNVPTLFLDATADPDVVKQVFGGIDYHSISIEMKSDVNLYQLGNTTISKSSLSNLESINDLVEWIQKDILINYDLKRVGIITYKNVPFEDCIVNGNLADFDEYLANRLGVSLFNHFGNLRGLDRFDKVDCLLVIGRNFIGVGASIDACGAIFGFDLPYETCYGKMDVRMKNGKSYLLESRLPADQFNRSIHQHFSLSETIQAIGRGRFIQGQKKDIYIFSNENLGSNIEVSDFFYRVKADKEICTSDVLSNIKRIGYVANTPKALSSVGFDESDIKSRRSKIESELLFNKIELCSCLMLDDKGRINSFRYFVADRLKFSEGREINNKTFLRFDD